MDTLRMDGSLYPAGKLLQQCRENPDIPMGEGHHLLSFEQAVCVIKKSQCFKDVSSHKC